MALQAVLKTVAKLPRTICATKVTSSLRIFDYSFLRIFDQLPRTLGRMSWKCNGVNKTSMSKRLMRYSCIFDVQLILHDE